LVPVSFSQISRVSFCYTSYSSKRIHGAITVLRENRTVGSAHLKRYPGLIHREKESERQRETEKEEGESIKQTTNKKRSRTQRHLQHIKSERFRRTMV
jgi:hypothetical protein